MLIMPSLFGNEFGPVNYLPVTVDFANATWRTTAVHEVFTVTGLVRVIIIPQCTENMAGLNNMKFGTATNIAAAPWVATTLKVDIDAGLIWLSAVPAAQYEYDGGAGASIIDAVLSTDDIGYEIETADASDGTIIFHCWWTALAPGSTVVAGAGGVL